MEYGITDSGFVKKPLSEILADEQEDFKKAFGYDIDVSNETPEGAYIANKAVKIYQLWEMLEGLWDACDSDSAEGIYLDRLVSLVNVSRKAAEPTVVYTALWGDEGTVVEIGHLAKITTGEQFSLQSKVTISRENLLGFKFKINELIENQTYSFSIDSYIISYAAQTGDDEAAIQAGLFGALAAVFPDIYEGNNEGADGMTIHSKEGIVPFYLFCDDAKIEISMLGAYGVYAAVVTGPTFVAIGELNKIVSNVSGLDSIINYASGLMGKNMESDEELREDKNDRQKLAGANELAIKNAIGAVSGVQYVEVYSNRTPETVDGRPPKSFEAVVVGGVDEEIARKILDAGPAGIEAFGTTVKTVMDDEGFPWEIGFSRPENRYIWLKIAFARNVEETFPLNGIELIKDKIDEWGAKNQSVGIDFVFQKLNKPIYEVAGISFVDIKVAVTGSTSPQPPAGDYVSENVSINERQIALIDKTRITIEELQT